MKITSEKLPASQVRFNIEIEGSHSQAVYDRFTKDLMRSVRVPGFRPGKAPKQMVLRHVGLESVRASVLEQLIKEVFEKLRTENDDLEMLSTPTLSPEADQLIEILKYGEPLHFSVTTDVQPEVIVKQYKGLSVKAEQVEPDFNEVDKILHQYRVKNATLIPVEDRPVELGDVVTVDHQAIDVADGQIITDLTDDDSQFSLDENLIELELFSMIVGMELGETRVQELTLPIDYVNEDLRGKTIQLTQTLKEIKCRDLPPLDDEFARSISNKETLAELRQYLTDRVKTDAELATEENIYTALSQALLPNLEIDPPTSMIESAIVDLIREQVNKFYEIFHGNTKAVNELLTPEFVAQMRQLCYPQACNEVKESLGLLEIARLEGLQVDPKELTTQVREFLENNQNQTKSIDPVRLRAFLEEGLLKKNAIEWLKTNALIELVPQGTLRDLDQESSIVTVETSAAVDPDQALSLESGATPIAASDREEQEEIPENNTPNNTDV